MRDTRKEGDHNTKRSPAGQAYLWGSDRQCPTTKFSVLFRTTPNTPKGTTKKSYILIHCMEGGLRDLSEL